MALCVFFSFWLGNSEAWTVTLFVGELLVLAFLDGNNWLSSSIMTLDYRSTKNCHMLYSL
jgi:hypothetical protein